MEALKTAYFGNIRGKRQAESERRERGLQVNKVRHNDYNNNNNTLSKCTDLIYLYGPYNHLCLSSAKHGRERDLILKKMALFAKAVIKEINQK